MAKSIPTPAGLELASLKAKRVEAVNLMAAGEGTPWEDRGSLGLIPAFFKTAMMSLSHPGKLLHAIRRPETSGDARGFAIGCSLCYLASVGVHCAAAYAWQLNHGVQFQNLPQYFLGWAMLGLLLAGLSLAMMVMMSRFFHSLVAAEEMKGKAPAVLTYNVFAYCFGPSILAIVPIVGPPAAALAILWLVIYGPIVRLRVNVKGAMICGFIVWLLAAVITIAGLWLVTWIWGMIFDPAVVQNFKMGVFDGRVWRRR